MVQQAGGTAGAEVERLERGTLRLWEVIVGGLSQAAPALSLYFTTAVLAGVASGGASRSSMSWRSAPSS